MYSKHRVWQELSYAVNSARQKQVRLKKITFFLHFS